MLLIKINGWVTIEHEDNDQLTFLDTLVSTERTTQSPLTSSVNQLIQIGIWTSIPITIENTNLAQPERSYTVHPPYPAVQKEEYQSWPMSPMLLSQTITPWSSFPKQRNSTQEELGGVYMEKGQPSW